MAEETSVRQLASQDMDLEAKHQQMQHAEDLHQARLEQMKAGAQGEDPRFADQKLKQADDLHREKVGQMRFQTKAQQDLHNEKLKAMKLKPKADAKPKPKEKK